MNTPKAKTHASVIVTRVSTGKQVKESTSPETQLDNCRVKSAALTLPIYAEYYDAGISGAFLLTRGGMQQALADIREGRADTLIVPNMSRYSRDTEHQQRIKKEVRAAGGRVVFCDMDFDETPEGDLAFGIFGNFAEYERQVIRARSMKGNRARAAQGLQPARCKSPYGYHVPTRVDVLHGRYTLAQVGQYLIVEEQAAVVRELFGRYAAGAESLYDLCHWLERAGVPTPGGGKFWRTTSLRYLLTNTVYKGQAAFGKSESRTDEALLTRPHPHQDRLRVDPTTRRETAPEERVVIPCPPLVDGDVWERANERLRENRKGRGGNPRRIFMLAGHVFCPECGAGMVLINGQSRHRGGQKHRYYQCGADKRENYPERRLCVPRAYRVEAVEAAVVEAVEDGCRRPRAIRELVESHRLKARAAAPGDVRAELRAIDAALESLRSEEVAAVQAQIAGIRQGAPADAYGEAFAALAARRKDLEDRRGQVSRAARPKAPATGEAVDAERLLEDVRKVLTSPHLTGAQKRNVLGLLIDKVLPTEGGARVLFRPGLFDDGGDGGGTPKTVQTVKTVYRKGGADGTAAAFPVGSAVTVVTRGLPSGLLMATIVTDSTADAAKTKAALKPIILSGLAADVQPDKGLVTVIPTKKPRQTISVTDATKIKVRKESAVLKDVTPGMRVSARLSHQKDGAGHLIATSLSAYDASVSARKKAAPKKAP